MTELKARAREEDLIEMLDGRTFWTDDNWMTAWARSRDGRRWRRVPEAAMGLVRFLAVSQSSWAGNAS